MSVHRVSHILYIVQPRVYCGHPPGNPSCATGNVPRNEVMSTTRHTATACSRGSNACLVARAEEGLRKSGFPRVDRHKCTAEQPHVGYTETPWEKIMVQ